LCKLRNANAKGKNKSFGYTINYDGTPCKVSEFESGLEKRPPVAFKPEIVNTTTKLLKIEPKYIIKAPKNAPFFMEFQNVNSTASASGFALDSSIHRTPMRYNELSSNEEVKPSLAPKNPRKIFPKYSQKSTSRTKTTISGKSPTETSTGSANTYSPPKTQSSSITKAIST
jgi:hypothetical protein